MQEPSNGFVLRRPMHGDVIVSSYHVVLGAVLWEGVGGPNDIAHYGLTCDVDRAHRFEHDAEDVDTFLSHILECNAALGRESDFVPLSERAGVSPTAFSERVATAVWLEVRVCAVPVFLRRFEGRIDRSAERTRDLWDAHRFSPSTVLAGRGLDVIRPYDRLVPISAAREAPRRQRRVRIVRWVNHSLAAHEAWSAWKLSLVSASLT